MDNILISDTARLTTVQIKRIAAIDKHFNAAGEFAYITSGIRSPDRQLRIIANFAINAGVASLQFRMWYARGRAVAEEIFTPAMKKIYWWQQEWSKCLNIGYIVNPPIECMCLEHSFRPDGSDRYGAIIHASPHLNPEGTCVDMSAGQDKTPSNELAVLYVAQQDPLCCIAGLTVERKQNCIHIDFSPPYQEA